MIEELEITVNHEAGLHLRPAALFVQTAAAFKADVRVRNATKDTPFKNAKSAIDVMTLGVSQGHRIVLQAEGEDSGDAIQALVDLIEANFNA